MSEQFLSRWGVIGVDGEDAVSFLHAQLTNDIANMTESQFRLAGLCTAQGRLLGSFFVIRHDKQVLLICRKDTIPALVKRLSMFVLRSKCKVHDCSAQYLLAYAAHSPLPQPMQVQWNQSLGVVASFRAVNGEMPSLGLTAINTEALPQKTGGDDAFELALQQLGIAYVSLATTGVFIPQTINFDLVGAVSFKKGCYPGQEVVARSHYLGKVKRRTVQATADINFPIHAGQDVWLLGKNNEPAGTVVTAVVVGSQYHLLVELPLDDIGQAGAVFSVKTETLDLPLQITMPPYDIHQKGNLFEEV